MINISDALPLLFTINYEYTKPFTQSKEEHQLPLRLFLVVAGT